MSVVVPAAKSKMVDLQSRGNEIYESCLDFRLEHSSRLLGMGPAIKEKK